MTHIVILGNGIAGITTARHIRKHSDHRITVISGETDHFFSRTALMYIYMGHMKFEHTKPYEDWFWEKNKIELKRGWVQEIDFDQKSLLFDNGDSIVYDKLVLTLGSRSNKFGWPGQDLQGVQGLYSYQDLESMESATKSVQRAVIVGGGLIGIEMAEMLHSRGIPVTYLVREKQFWDIVLPDGEAKLIGRHIQEHGIDLRLETELKEIVDGGDGRVTAVVTHSGKRIDCQFVGLTVGVSPNIGLVAKTKLETDRGILVNECLETNIPDVYAAGDCAQVRNPSDNRRSIEAVWYVGRMMGETLAKTLTGSRTLYDPGIWFNSAKFLDIEYQTYGNIGPGINSTEHSFYWEHPKGQLCLHFVFDKSSERILGVNALGIRLRHEQFDHWIKSEKSIEYVLEHLKDANFDPEFYRQHEHDIVTAFNQQFNRKIQSKRMSWSRIMEVLTP